MAECFTFYKRNQAMWESVVEYVVELRKLATYCEFGTFLDWALRDRFICGLRDEAIQKKLLMKSELEFAWGIEIA